MSISAQEWALKTDLNIPSEILVLVVLAFHHNARTGKCNPKISTLSSMAGVNERSVSRILRKLEIGGYIRTFPCRNRGKQTSNQYVLNIEGLVFRGAPPRALKQKTDCHGCHPPPVTGDTPPLSLVTPPYKRNEQELEQELEHISTSPESLVNNSSVLKFPKKGTAK